MKELILIGATACGKTTLCQSLHGIAINYHKTQAVEFFDEAIDTPGEYIENRHFYSALNVSAADANVIGLVQSVTDVQSYFPPMFASMFAKPVIGIITKIDLAEDEKKIRQAENYLAAAGVEQVFSISAFENKGIVQLQNYLSQIKGQ
ncbi:EutP/PduV family microcompartment system protein [Bacillaceae bacterium Marseille-Q3522]|nr:EutP/PduV family microcompartment system protein [Bacillaceae bacterium Marseille-Q3522]